MACSASLTASRPVANHAQLRLQQARHLMFNQNLDAGIAGNQVGYESASQFSREYNRLFGLPPQQDVKRMRMSDDSMVVGA